jgi:hypothetical protein
MGVIRWQEKSSPIFRQSSGIGARKNPPQRTIGPYSGMAEPNLPMGPIEFVLAWQVVVHQTSGAAIGPPNAEKVGRVLRWERMV